MEDYHLSLMPGARSSGAARGPLLTSGRRLKTECVEDYLVDAVFAAPVSAR